MKENMAWLFFGVAVVIGLTLVSITMLIYATQASEAKWIVCIEAGKQMVQGVCL